VRAALLKPASPVADPDWDFAFGAKVNNINLGKCRPLDQAEQQRRQRIVDWTIGISRWMRELNGQGYVASIVAVKYRPLQGHLSSMLTTMMRELDPIFGGRTGKLVTRIRRTGKDGLRAIFVPDNGAWKAKKKLTKEMRQSDVNGGWHVGGLVFHALDSRLRVPLRQHFEDNQKLYTHGSRIAQISARPISDNIDQEAATLADYLFKSSKPKRDVNLMDYIGVYGGR
jgi:hypothetical protein